MRAPRSSAGVELGSGVREVVRDPGVMAALDHGRACGIRSFGASVSDLEAGLAALETGVYDTLQFPFNSANPSLAPLLAVMREADAPAIINRPFAMGSLILGANQDDTPARAGFRFIADHVERGVVLTGTGKAAHLAENVAAFRRRDTVARDPG